MHLTRRGLVSAAADLPVPGLDAFRPLDKGCCSLVKV